MSTYLPKDVLAGLAEAKTATLRKKSRMWVEFDGNMYPVLRMWERGFAMDANAAPALRGFVDVFEGGEHKSQCLIIASNEENGELQFEFKRYSSAQERPPLDYAKRHDAPIALIENH